MKKELNKKDKEKLFIELDSAIATINKFYNEYIMIGRMGGVSAYNSELLEDYVREKYDIMMRMNKLSSSSSRDSIHDTSIHTLVLFIDKFKKVNNEIHMSHKTHQLNSNTKVKQETNRYGLTKKSYTKKEVAIMFGFTAKRIEDVVRSVYGLEEAGLKKTLVGKEGAKKPPVAYLVEDIISFLDSHPKYHEKFKGE